MQETCTSGSVRGGDGDIPTYSALDAPQRGDEALERGLVGEPGMRVEERQLAGVVRIREHRQHPAAEQAGQQVDVHEEVGAAGDPSRPVGREPSAGHDHVHVRIYAARLIMWSRRRE